MPNVFHVNPYLVSSPSLEPAFNQINVSQALQYFVMSYCMFAALAILKNSKNLPVFWAATNVADNRSLFFFKISPNQRNVFPFGRFFKKLK